VGAALPGTPARSASAQVRSAARRAKNLIFMVSDGMSYGTLTLADACHRQRFDRPCNWVSMLNEKAVRRRLRVYLLRGLARDRLRRGATAWSIGERVNNSRVCMTPDNRFPTPLFVHAAQQGRAIGLVTTTTSRTPTPAGFIANVPDRAMEGEIGVQMMERGFDVALGGGRSFFPESTLRIRDGVARREEHRRTPRGGPRRPAPRAVSPLVTCPTRWTARRPSRTSRR